MNPSDLACYGGITAMTGFLYFLWWGAIYGNRPNAPLIPTIPVFAIPAGIFMVGISIWWWIGTLIF